MLRKLIMIMFVQYYLGIGSQDMINTLFKTPYRLFFLLGTIALFVGLIIWILPLIDDQLYFGRMHAHYMIGIFLLSFVIGFLMTAIPRMSNSRPASHKEMLLQLMPMLFAAFFGLYQINERPFFLSLVIALVILFRFASVRIIKAPQVIPDVFPMVLVGLFSGLAGALFNFFDYTEIGNRLFYLNFVLALCVGIGARLLPMIMNVKCSYSAKTSEFLLIGALLTLACFIEVYVSENFGNAIRAMTMTAVFFRHWKAHLFEGPTSSVAWGLRFAAFSMLFGSIGLWLFPSFRLEALHIIYVSGFGLLTIMVASRVILAHGNHDLKLEFGNWFIKIPMTLIILAGVTRVSAAFLPAVYEQHLAYAAISFLSGCLLWSYFFLPKLLDLDFEKSDPVCETVASFHSHDKEQ